MTGKEPVKCHWTSLMGGFWNRCLIQQALVYGPLNGVVLDVMRVAGSISNDMGAGGLQISFLA